MTNKTLTNLKHLSPGSLSSRCTFELGGIPYFFKTHLSTQSCSGNTSRQIISNELLVYQVLLENGPERYYYVRGPMQRNGIIGILFQDLLVRPGTMSLAKRLEVHDPGPTPDLERGNDDLPRKEGIRTQNSIPLEEIVDITLQISRQVEWLHAPKHISGELADTYGFSFGKEGGECGGVVHMDISPDNVMLVPEHGKKKALLMDFGIAREKEKTLRQFFNEALPGPQGGNYKYTSGENIPMHNTAYCLPSEKLKGADGKGINAEAYLDTYNICNLLCLMLTGHLVEHWKAANGSDTAVVTETIQQSIDNPFAEKLTHIIVKGTSDAITDLYQDAASLVEDLENLLIPEPVEEVFSLRHIAIPAVIRNNAAPLASTDSLYAADLELAQEAEQELLSSADVLFPGSVMGDDGLQRAIARARRKEEHPAYISKGVQKFTYFSLAWGEVKGSISKGVQKFTYFSTTWERVKKNIAPLSEKARSRKFKIGAAVAASALLVGGAGVALWPQITDTYQQWKNESSEHAEAQGVDKGDARASQTPSASTPEGGTEVAESKKIPFYPSGRELYISQQSVKGRYHVLPDGSILFREDPSLPIQRLPLQNIAESPEMPSSLQEKVEDLEFGWKQNGTYSREGFLGEFYVFPDGGIMYKEPRNPPLFLPSENPISGPWFRAEEEKPPEIKRLECPLYVPPAGDFCALEVTDDTGLAQCEVYKGKNLIKRVEFTDPTKPMSAEEKLSTAEKSEKNYRVTFRTSDICPVIPCSTKIEALCKDELGLESRKKAAIRLKPKMVSLLDIWPHHCISGKLFSAPVRTLYNGVSVRDPLVKINLAPTGFVLRGTTLEGTCPTTNEDYTENIQLSVTYNGIETTINDSIEIRKVRPHPTPLDKVETKGDCYYKDGRYAFAFAKDYRGFERRTLYELNVEWLRNGEPGELRPRNVVGTHSASFSSEESMKFECVDLSTPLPAKGYGAYGTCYSAHVTQAKKGVDVLVMVFTDALPQHNFDATEYYKIEKGMVQQIRLDERTLRNRNPSDLCDYRAYGPPLNMDDPTGKGWKEGQPLQPIQGM